MSDDPHDPPISDSKPPILSYRSRRVGGPGKMNGVKPSRFIVVFLLGGIFVSGLLRDWSLAMLLGGMLAICLVVAFLAAIFPRPGSGDEMDRQD